MALNFGKKKKKSSSSSDAPKEEVQPQQKTNNFGLVSFDKVDTISHTQEKLYEYDTNLVNAQRVSNSSLR